MALNTIGISGPFSLPPASFDINTLRTALESATIGSDAGRLARIANALQAAKAQVGDTPVLQSLTLSATTARVGVNTTILIGGAIDGSRIDISAVPDGLTLSSAQRTLSGVPTLVGTYQFDVTETLAGAIGSPRSTRFTLITDQVQVNPTLNDLYLSNNVATVGVPFNATINGATSASSISAQSLPAGLSLSSANRRITGTPTAVFSGRIQLIEMLSGATNSPHPSSIQFTVAAPAITLQTLSLSGDLLTGAQSSGTITGKTSGSTLTTTVPGLTITGTSYTFDGSAASGAYAITETLAGATNSPLSSQVVVQAAGSTGGVTWTGVTWTGVTWGGGGTTPPAGITLSVGSVTSAAEGTPSTGITLSVGSITSQPEGNPSSGITLSVGSITAQPEGN